jgi:hypothetical protein
MHEQGVIKKVSEEFISWLTTSQSGLTLAMSLLRLSQKLKVPTRTCS